MPDYVSSIQSMKVIELKTPPFFFGEERDKFESSKIRIMEILEILGNTAAILESNAVPLPLVRAYLELRDDFYYTHLDGFVKINPESVDAPGRYRDGMTNLTTYHLHFFEAASSNNKMFLINSIDNYKLLNTVNLEAKANRVIDKVEDSERRVNAITKKLEDDSTKKVLSDYAIIFKNQETKYKGNAGNWFLVAILTSAVFLSVFIYSIKQDWFKNIVALCDDRDGHTYVHDVFNIPALIGKAVIISFVLYLISFCFRQYSINKNLQVINEQRKNAIDSYVLFEASAGSDNSSKGVLLMQLAKSIYQMTQTGFLSGKQSDVSSNQLLELTRVFQGGKSE